ncbi:DUF4386 family protein [Oscillochloris sp. ZM17-4]|uniref:DUF4386 family protein n=1 Tax=Oscillochloris sp. ZM17-4 TaxID=2866714 RepID=UPI001C72DB5C|nr:DUF4386 family protein [Oscillochloris sp. ZM17-4]MBX0329680.1 DUF4386 family protein [Oscillochloris sp. ZM17-4]
MRGIQRPGGIAALYQGLAYVVGMIGFLLVVNVGDVADPAQKVALIGEHQGFLSLLHLVVYVFWGIAMVVLALAVHERLQGGAPALMQVASAFGLIWAGLVLASGMIYNVGMQAVVGLAGTAPEQAAPTWLAIEAVFNGLGGGVEVVGGVWVLLLTWAALRAGGLPRALNHWGLGVGLAGLCTVVPAISEVSAAVFGLSQIVWFLWLGIVLLRSRAPHAAYEPTTAAA